MHACGFPLIERIWLDACFGRDFLDAAALHVDGGQKKGFCFRESGILLHAFTSRRIGGGAGRKIMFFLPEAKIFMLNGSKLAASIFLCLEIDMFFKYQRNNSQTKITAISNKRNYESIRMM